MVYRVCADCGQEDSFHLNEPMSISCQVCGSPYIKFSQKVKITCIKCEKDYDFSPNKIAFAFCKECNGSLWIVKTKHKKDLIYDSMPQLKSNLLKVVIPYYKGGPNVERAINTWLLPEVVFAIVDDGIIPPGSGICSQINTTWFEQNGKRYPYFTDTMRRLLEIYPDYEYYGYFNSDIILPPGIPIYQLLPRKDKVAVMHHRLDVNGSNTTPIRELSPHHITVVGKDGFILSNEVMHKMCGEFPNFVLGWPFWDTALAIWLWDKYGWEKIDFAYREIFHVQHKSSGQAISEYETKGGKYNHKLAKTIFKKDYTGDIWKEVCNEASSNRKKKTEKLKVGIIQPGRIGDILLVLPIAKWYYDKGYEVIWPVYKDYMPLFDRINYVHPLPIDNFKTSYSRARELLKGVPNIIDLGIGFGREEGEWRESGLTFDEWKYKIAGVPISEKYNLQTRRDYEAEQDLKNFLRLDKYYDGYIVTHSKSSFAEYDFNIPDAIEIEPIQGFHLFDWIGVLEHARYIYCVDSCIANLVNQLHIGKGKRYIKTWHNIRERAEANRLTPVLHGWEVHKPIFCEKEYPEYINDNNAVSHIVNKALKFCKGKGADLGGGENPLPGAKNLTWPNIDLNEPLHYKNLDYIFSSHCFEHLTDYKKTLKYCYESLKPKGILFLYLPHPCMKYWLPKNMPGHKHIMLPDTVIEAIKEAGFKIIEKTSMPDHYYSFYVIAKKPDVLQKSDLNIIVKGLKLKITTITIAFNAMPFIKPCVEMMKTFSDQIIVIEGCIKDLFKVGYLTNSTDGTEEYLMNEQSKGNLLLLQKGKSIWQNKEEMQNAALSHVDNSYIWLVDSDEFYKKSTIRRIIHILERERPDQINFPLFNFFKSSRYIVKGGYKFNNLTNDVRRIFKITGPFNRFVSHRPPELNYTPEKVIFGSRMKRENCYMYHFPYIFDDQVKMKCLLYEQQLSEDHKGIWNWYNNFFLKWTPKNRKKLEAESDYGAWYPDRVSRTVIFNGKIPNVVKPIFKRR